MFTIGHDGYRTSVLTAAALLDPLAERAKVAYQRGFAPCEVDLSDSVIHQQVDQSLLIGDRESVPLPKVREGGKAIGATSVARLDEMEVDRPFRARIGAHHLVPPPVDGAQWP